MTGMLELRWYVHIAGTKMYSNYIKIYKKKNCEIKNHPIMTKLFMGTQFITVFCVITVILSDLPTYGSQMKISYCTML